VEGFEAFLKEWVFGVEDRTGYVQHYIERFGYKAFRDLAAEFDYGYPVSYAY
jgi:glutaconate CoA-transferase subunit A